MAHSKNHKLRCFKCGSTKNVHCKGGRIKICDSTIAIEYIFNCGVCGYHNARTVFSRYDKNIKMYDLKCPFCGSGRKRHIFNVKLKEIALTKIKEEMNRLSRKKKHKLLIIGSGKNGNIKNHMFFGSHNSLKKSCYPQ